PAKVEEVLEVVTAAKLLTEVVTTAAPITTIAQVQKASAPRRIKGVVIQDPEERVAASVIVHKEVKPKDKGKDILIEEPKPLKGQEQIDMDEAFARKPIFKKHYNSIQAFLEKGEKEIKEEGSKRKGSNLEQDMAKKQRIDEEAEELK
nr:hypothetical protein [Tanacetum cinerariifolium]